MECDKILSKFSFKVSSKATKPPKEIEMFKKQREQANPKRKIRLLVEPTIEEERLAEKHSYDFTSRPEKPPRSERTPEHTEAEMDEEVARGGLSAGSQNVIASELDSARQRRRQKSQLTSFLVILFGSLLLVGCFAVQLVHPMSQALNSSPPEAGNNSLASSQPEQGIASSPITTPPPPKPPSESVNSTLPDAASDPDGEPEMKDPAAPSEGEGEPEGDIEEDSDEPPASSDNTKNKDLIVSTLTDAADLFISRLKAGEREELDSEDLENDVDSRAEGTPSNGTRAQASTEEAPSKRQAAALTNAPTTNSSSEELRAAMESYTKWRQGADEIIELSSKKLLPLIVEHGYHVDALTVTGVLQVFNAVRSLKPWALKLLDSWAKLSPGILVGTQSDFGDFDECLNVRADDPNGLEESNPDIPVEYDEATGLKSTTVVGKYCLADVLIPLPPRQKLAQRNEELNTDYAPIELRRPLLNFSETALFKDTIFVETGNFFNMLYVDPIRVAFCLTNKISEESFAKVFNILAEPLSVKIDFKGRCVTKYDRTPWTIQQKVSAWLLGVVCALVLCSTLLDVLHTKLNKLPLPSFYLFDECQLEHWKSNLRYKLFPHRPLFTSFSIIRNTKRLFRPQADKLAQSGLGSCQEGSSGLPPGSNCSTSGGSTPSVERRGSSSAGSALNLLAGQQQQQQVLLFDSKQRQLVMKSHFELPTGAEVKQTGSSVNLMCLHGVRVITMTWMIVNHTYLFGGFFVLWAHRRLIDIAEWPKSISFQLVLNGWLTVETYFFLSALIIVLNIMPLFKSNNFAYFRYILHRLLRLLPGYVGLVCLNFLWPLLSSGPVWMVKGKSFIQTPCENYLWTNFLFINNWIWPEKQCMVHTWFLSADLQLYLLAPIIVYLLYRRPVFGHSLNILIGLLASLVSGLVIYANKLMPSTLINKLEFDSIKQQLSYSYFATYQHMGPYCLGIFTGYLLYKRPHVRLPRHLTWTLWLLLPPLSFTTLFLTYLWNGAYPDPSMTNPSPVVSAFYVAIHRTIWSSLIAWLVFACSTGRAKMLASFLSHSIFVPLSRLSFSIYLVHLPVIMFRALNLRHTVEWTDGNILWEACGNFIVSLLGGYFVNVTFESPFVNLEAAFLGRPQEVAKQKGSAELADSQTHSEEGKFELSSNNSEQQSEGSPEELSAAGGLQVDWSMAAAKRLPRKAFRPKENLSVEKIFGEQLEPAAESSPSSELAAGEESLNSNCHSDEEAFYPRAANIYLPAASFAGENRKLPGRGYHPERSLLREPLPGSQYATLARMSRLEQSWRERPSPAGHYRRPRGAPSSLLSDFSPPSEPYQQHWTGLQGGSEMGLPASRFRASGRLDQLQAARRARQNRYNTLDGSGALLEWSRRYAEPARLLENTGSWLQQQRQQEGCALMIPRIDSSTLRRQQQLPSNKRQLAKGSIVEEPAEDGRESAML